MTVLRKSTDDLLGTYKSAKKFMKNAFFIRKLYNGILQAFFKLRK